MRTATAFIMLMAVLLTLLGPVHIGPCMSGGDDGPAIVTLDVCNMGGGDTAASGVAVYLNAPDNALSLTLDVEAVELAENTTSPIVFLSGLDHPPQA